MHRLDSSLIAILLVLAAALSTPIVAEDAPRFRLYLEEDGVYRVTHEALVAAGLPDRAYPSEMLSLALRGEAVLLWVEDGGDEQFGAGDAFELVGQRLHGDGTYFHDHAQLNVYWLSFDGEHVARIFPDLAGAPATEASSLLRRLHVEEDRLMIRLSEDEMGDGDAGDLWFWAKLTHADTEPFQTALQLDGLASEATAVELRVGLRALSRPNRQSGEKISDHRVEALVDGELVGAVEWDGRTVETLELTLAGLEPGEHQLALRVPKRQPPGTADPLVDVVMLNWIDISYPHSGVIPGDAVALDLLAPTADAVAELSVQAGRQLRIYTSDGRRLAPPAATATTYRFTVPAGELYAVVDDYLRQPLFIERDRPSRLRSPAHRADYLIVAHPRLLPEVLPLAEHHRQRGLEVSVVDVQDVWDEFGDGIVHPRALRDFISYAYHGWQRPAPRFVLLVGDASWDTKNAEIDDANYANWTSRQLLAGDRFVARNAPVYREAPTLPHRNLIPTSIYATGHGHSASDNYFVAVDGDDFLPDLAIGRFPVAEPAEVRAIVAKTIAYAAAPEVGPWRREVLWITNESDRFQLSTDHLAAQAEARGFSSSKIYPRAEEEDNALHQEAIQEAFDRGQLLVHFLGHGGRHIWRTGPPDFRKNHDLFTLEHLDDLAAHGRLPMILSMTCFSAPFDHPNADSIGEKFLRLADKGAVAIFAASWRNSPTQRLSQMLIDELMTPGAAIGTAILRTKRDIQNRTLIETYNLLGDPAIELALPSLAVALERGAGDSIVAAIDHAAFTGRGLVDWLAGDGSVLASEEIAKAGAHFTLRPAAEISREVDRVRVYVWNEEEQIDGIGVLSLGGQDVDATEPSASASASD